MTKQPPMTDAQRVAAIAKLEVDPVMRAVVTIGAWQSTASELLALFAELTEQARTVRTQGLGPFEMMLVAQIQMLDKVANACLTRAAKEAQAGECQAHLRMGLEAQERCAATILTLKTLHTSSAKASRSRRSVAGAAA